MKLGDCYEAAFQYMLSEGPGSGLKLVHAEVMGQGPLAGVSYGHAFVLDGDTVIDKSNGRDLRMPAPAYYELGRIEYLDNIHEYDYVEMLRRALEYEHYGPWDLQTSTGL
jgi:hypothetical protein